MMNKKLYIFTCLLMVSAFLLLPSASGQTAPTATTTFTDAGDGAWTTGANWDVQVPIVSDDALIGAGETASYDEIADGDAPFGTLTLGANATLQYSSGNNKGLPSGSIVYFSDGSHLEYTAGTVNRGATLYVIPGASGQITFKNNSIPSYTYSGGGDLLHIVIQGVLYTRNDATGFTGELRYSSSSPGSARRVNLSNFGGSQKLGPGLSTFEDGVYTDLGANNKMHDSATVKLVGGTGGSNPKLDIGGRTDTISNLIIDSPTGTADTFERDVNGVLTVTNTVTFQGTAGSVVLDDTQSGPSGSGLVTSNMTFVGTGTWILSGDSTIALTGGTLSNDFAATISNPMNIAGGGFTKTGSGSGTLTLGGASSISGEGTINVSSGTLAFASASRLPPFGTLSIDAYATNDLNYAGIGSVLYLSLGGTNMALGLYGHTTSGADNGGAGVGAYDDYFANSAGVITNGNGYVPNLFYWDGGTINIVGNGDLASGGGAGTWDTTIENWDVGFVAHGVWGNDSANEVIFGGSAGTVTLSQDVTLKSILFPDVSGYTITGNILNFPAGGSITNADNTYAEQFISSGITGNPAVGIAARGNYWGITFNPTTTTQELGRCTIPYNDGGGDKCRLTLSGTTESNTVVDIAVDYEQGRVTKDGTGTWSIGDAGAVGNGSGLGWLYIQDGNLILTGTVSMKRDHDVNLNGGVLHYNNAGAVTILATPTGAINFGGGDMDNSSGAAITTSTYDPPMEWYADWTFIGSLGANSDLNLGAGTVTLNADRQVTVQNAAATLSINGVISGSGYSLSKAGPGTLELGGANAYSGGTFVDAGTLMLSGGSAIVDASSLWVTNGASVDVAADETVAGLYLDGEQAYAGTWGSSSSGAMFQNDTYFSGTGKLTVSAGTEVVVSDPATGQTTVDATWHGTVRAPDIDWDVYVHWGTTDGGTDAGSWDGVVFLGNWSGTDSAAITFVTNSLTPDTTYYYTFQASNAVTNVWASPSTVFGTLGPPIVTTNTGASNFGQWSADLNGVLTSGGTALVYVCWGEDDGGTATTSNWENVVGIPSGSQLMPFSASATGLLYGILYDYRVYATNGFGSDWSDVATFGPSFPEYFGMPVTANLEVHYDADLGVVTNVSGEVTNWADQSGHGRDLISWTGTPTLQTNELGGKPVVRFNASNENLQMADGSDEYFSMETYLVFRSGYGSSFGPDWGAPYGVKDGDNADRTWMFRGNEDRFWNDERPASVNRNGVIVSSSGEFDMGADMGQYMVLKVVSGPNNGTQIREYIVGTRTDAWANSRFDTAEVIAYSVTNTVADENMIGGWLAWKYGISTTYPPLSNPESLGVTNLSLFNVNNSSLDLSATLNATQSVFTVSAYWSLIDNADGAAWLADGTASSSLIGTYTNVDAEALAASINGITRGTNYFNMRAYNEVTNIWISANQSVWLEGLAEGTLLQFR